jgi:flagellar basal-body rod protein FlgG
MLIGENGPISIGQENLSDPMITGDKRFFNLKITTNGEVFANDYLIGAVAVTKIENPETLKRSSGQAFVATEQTNISNIDLAEVRIRQGWIEESNVDIIREMVDMIELQRQFETGGKVIQTSDRTIEEAIRIGRYF